MCTPAYSRMYKVTRKKSNLNNYNKHQMLMPGFSGTGKSIWPGDHHLRGRSIVPVHPVWCRILLRSHKVAVRLLKEIALQVGHWLTPHITQGNTHLGDSRCLEKPERHRPPSHRSGPVPPLMLLFHTSMQSHAINPLPCLAMFASLNWWHFILLLDRKIWLAFT